MKSLEIVNEKMQQINTPTKYCAGININLFELEQIKQDLEVLEILRNNLYYWYGNAGKPITEIHTFLNDYNKPKEFNKVKQWLEANENESI